MESYGSEIGQKMRSAVKAKLLELGTGGSAAYIDDELPDYVMIMVANKRSKQQMTTDLNLFLGSQTELFVTWLHEVLQKLQEVTLPATSASNKKRKSHPSISEAAGKKDKKGVKKDKKPHKKSVESQDSNDVEKPTTTTDAGLSIASKSFITDVFAEELLEKAKKTLDVSSSMKEEIKKKKRKASVDQNTSIETQKSDTQKDSHEFDIPTISEITSTTGGNSGISNAKELPTAGAVIGSREKDLAELAEIQKKIYAAKKHLREIGELNDNDESEDEDFLNLKDDEQESAEYDLADNAEKSIQPNLKKKVKSPIIFNKNVKTPEVSEKPSMIVHGPALPQKSIEKDIVLETEKPQEIERERERVSINEERNERRSVHDRLGTKPAVVQERRPRQQKELYVPAHRRRECDTERRERERPRQREHVDQSKVRDHSREQVSREKPESQSRKRRASPVIQRRQPRSISSELEQPRPKQRVVSHVIVAQNKPLEASDNEDINEKPVNSIIKVKPRPPVSPSRQACKTLLLRAVADAQRSTILVKTERKKAEPDISVSINKHIKSERKSGTKLFSKSFRERERFNRIEPSGELFRRTTRNLVVEVKNGKGAKRKRTNSNGNITSQETDEVYVPKMSIDGGDDSQNDYDVYVPQVIAHHIDVDIEDTKEVLESVDQFHQDTQFVVTLHGDDVLEKYRKRSSASRKRSLSPLPQVTSSSTGSGPTKVEPSSTTGSLERGRRRKSDIKTRLTIEEKLDHQTPSHSPSSSNTPPPLPTRNLRRSDVLRLPNEIKKIIIKDTTDEDDELSPKKALLPLKRQANKRQLDVAANGYRKSTIDEINRTLKLEKHDNGIEERSTTPPLPPNRQTPSLCPDGEKRSEGVGALVVDHVALSSKIKHTPIKFTLKIDEQEHQISPKRIRTNNSLEREQRDRGTSVERRRISIRTAEDRKYDNIPTSLNSVSVDSTVLKVVKPKERCKYHPNCTKQFCDYYHPTAPCKSFPNCKFADKCLYSHPKCKYDLSCMSIDCNFAHSGTRDFNHSQLTAPPLSSHVIPVQNYKSISASSVATGSASTMCKYYPNCTKAACTFYHPKPCRYGKNCINKMECAYYHPEMQSSNKFKWVASIA